MTGLTILGFVLIVLGVIVGFGQGAQLPINMMSSQFMTFLVSAFVLITIGVALIKNVSNWLTLGLLWITIALTIIYLYGYEMKIWVVLSGVVVILGIGWWLTILILRKFNQ